MQIILSFFLALFLSIVLIPVLMKYAPRWKLVDAPDPRKSHAGMMPRIGGLGIAFGTLVPCLLWTAHDRIFFGYLTGALIIVAFGVLDDRFDLDFRAKLLGQVAAVAVVMASGLGAFHLPLFGLDAVSDFVAYPVTFVFLLGVTNAFNLLDGLDGLAAGCAILSLATLALLGVHVGGGAEVVLMALAAIGGILGFLRYNTHPALVFMGDAGSQFLGFSIAALAIMLVEHTQNAWSPAIVLPALGLPVLDTLMVMLLRIRDGHSLFSPDRNHIHHRLLSLGLKHHQAVAVIYGVQALMVAAAYLLRFESDALVLAVYGAICLVCILAYRLAQRWLGRSVHPAGSVAASLHLSSARWNAWISRARSAAIRYVEWGVAGYLVIGAAVIHSVPPDISILALALAAVTILVAVRQTVAATTVIRIAAYLAVIYVSYRGAISPRLDWMNTPEFNAWLTSVGGALAFIVIFSPREQFQFSTLDLLIVLVVVGIVSIPTPFFDQIMVSRVVIRSLVLIYACEVLLAVERARFKAVALVATLSLLALGGHLLLEGGLAGG